MEKSAKRTVLLVLAITVFLCMTAFSVSCSAGNRNSKAVQQKIAAECPFDSAKDGYGKGVYFIFPEPFRVTYYIYGGSIIEMSQEYDEKTSKWSTVAEHESERTAED